MSGGRCILAYTFTGTAFEWNYIVVTHINGVACVDGREFAVCSAYLFECDHLPLCCEVLRNLAHSVPHFDNIDFTCWWKSWYNASLWRSCAWSLRSSHLV